MRAEYVVNFQGHPTGQEGFSLSVSFFQAGFRIVTELPKSKVPRDPQIIIDDRKKNYLTITFAGRERSYGSDQTPDKVAAIIKATFRRPTYKQIDSDEDADYTFLAYRPGEGD